MPEIVVKFADRVIERVVTEQEHLSIGRTSDNDIVLDNRGVSRHHARIEFGREGAEVLDLNSLNGTFVNQIRINRQILKDCDVVTIGKFDLVYHTESQAAGKMSDFDPTMVLETKKQKELSQSGKANPLESFMETRPIPTPPQSDAKSDRKEHR